MDLDHVGRIHTGTLVQFVDVLGDEGVEDPPLLQCDEGVVALVGFDVGPQAALGAQRPVLLPHLGVTHVEADVGGLLGLRVLGPDAVGATEVGDARVGGDARAGQHEDLLGPVDELSSAIQEARIHVGVFDRHVLVSVHGPDPTGPQTSTRARVELTES